MNSVGTITRFLGPISPSRQAKSTSPAARPSATGGPGEGQAGMSEALWLQSRAEWVQAAQ